jgi:hypothetical protein
MFSACQVGNAKEVEKQALGCHRVLHRTMLPPELDGCDETRNSGSKFYESKFPYLHDTGSNLL